MPKGIDYSKWDNMDYGSSDEEGPQQPQVTRLDQPSRITTTPGDGTGFKVEEIPSKSPLPPNKERLKATKKEEDLWTSKGGVCELKGRQIYWAQDRQQVLVRLEIREEPKNLEVRLHGSIEKYQNRHTAVGTEYKAALELIAKNESVFDSELSYAVHWAEDDEGDGVLDWTLSYRDSKKFVTFQLHKATPMQNVTVWWNCLFQGMNPIELADTKRNTEFQAAWEEAHRQFKAKVAAGTIKRPILPKSD